MATSAVPIPDPTADKPPRRRRWIPMSLRIFGAILILVGMVSAFSIGWPAYRQAVAIEEIERVGGEIQSLPGGPKILRAWVGDERMRPFDEVYAVYLDRTETTNGTLDAISCLSQLQYLSLVNTQIDDEGLTHLRSLRSLDDLNLTGTRITDSGLIHLRSLTKLQSLGLTRTHITDAGLEHLKGLTDLESLSVDATFVGPGGVADLCRALPGLVNVYR
jgi:Leucine-rich repeat (LRR) protein